MGNNTSMTGDQMKKLGYVEDGAGTGNFVHISKLTANGRKVDKINIGDILDQGRVIKIEPSPIAKKVDKLPNLIERAIPFVEEIGKTKMSIQNIIGKYGDFLTESELTILHDKSGPAFNNVLLQGRIDELNAQEAFDLFNKTGYMFAKPHTYETFLLPDGSYIDVLYSLDISPVSAPRMTQSDKWKLDPNHIDPLKRQRKPVEKYFKFKQDLLSLCAVNGYNLTERLNILFVVPMPDGWSKNKRYAMNNQPHKQRPDRDNYLKAFQDSFKGDDGHVWDGRTIKLWGAKGRIIIF